MLLSARKRNGFVRTEKGRIKGTIKQSYRGHYVQQMEI
jgi:hypothetical protein